MKILKLFPARDHKKRFNYAVNYGVWDSINGDIDSLERFNSDLDNYDVVFLPQIKRWDGNIPLLNKIKDHKVKTVLFDNDSCYRNFTDIVYSGIDYIFYRDADSRNKKPIQKSSLLKWSVDTDVFTPVYGGKGICFNCSIGDYPLRKSIAKFLRHEKVSGYKYVWNIQKSAAAIHTDSDRVKAVRGKVLEFAACGTQIISNRTKNMDLYFPDELITYFDSVHHLKEIIKDFEADIDVQRKLREIVEDKHTHTLRAIEVLSQIWDL